MYCTDGSSAMRGQCDVRIGFQGVHVALAEFRIAASGDPRLALELQLVIVQAQVAGLEVELVRVRSKGAW